MIVLSDGFDRSDDLVNALRHLRHRRHEVLFFQTVAPEEEEFPFSRPAKFRDLERPGATCGSTPRRCGRRTSNGSRPIAAPSARGCSA